jgi:MYXO-CTERM domain-containing protein
MNHLRWLSLSGLVVAAAAGCSPGADPVQTVQAAVFANGSFESDAIGNAPTSWTVSSYQNEGITDTRPAAQTMASLKLQTGGYAATFVVGGTAESQTDPDLGTGASFRYPKYGSRALRINLGTGFSTGAFKNVNGASQTMTVANGDVDTSDNKVHVRFAVAPVLQNPAHDYIEQPYYFVQLRNITKGTTLYQDFNASAQTGVPWKTVGTVYYTDWQLVDIAPGNAALAVGDQVELQILAAGCAQIIHWGRIYVDGVGSTIPGLYTWGTGPQSVNAGADLTYTLNYKNGGTTTTSGTKLELVIPADTTFQSVSLPAACTAPAVGATGTVVCTLGSLAAGASGALTVTVKVAAAATGTITNGNYYIYATSVSPLLGPKVQTAVTSNVTYSDVSITKTDGVAAIGWGQATTYTITASNAGPSAAASVSIADAMPAELTGVTWTCAGAGGGTCPAASGSGSIAATGVALPVGGSVTYTVQASIIAGSGSGSVTNTATATVAAPGVDSDTSNNSAVDTDSIGTLRTLTLTKTGAVGGTVATSPASISCGTSCSSASGSFLNGTSVVLTASAVPGGTFTGWGGDCASAGTATTCTLTMSANRAVTAAFVPPSTISVSSGSPQTTTVSTAFALPLKALVVDSSMNPLAGVTVVFSAPGSGASATLGAATATTDAQGIASVTVTANATAGAYQVTAGISGTTASTTFSLANIGAPASITVVSGSGQSATVGTAFASPLVVVVRDSASQLVPNATVTFAAPATGARATLGATTATSNASGQASVSATAGTVAGGYNVTASVSGVATAATFALTNSVGAAAAITATSGGGQSATVGAAFTSPLVATVTDSFGNPIAGVTVTFAAPTTGARATLATTTATTDAAGQVSSAATANSISGGYAVTAAATGVATAASFALTNSAGAPASITATSGGGQATLVGTAFASGLVVTVRDAASNLVPGATVTFTAPASGAAATFASATATTNAAGQASAAATANATVGMYSVSAAVSGVGTAAAFSLRNYTALALSPATVTVAPRGAQSFTASGGPGATYTYGFATNASGGTINTSTGVYAAGATGSVTDVIQVTDGVGATATATVTVGPGVSVSPSTGTVAPRGTQSFSATGGSGTGFAYTFVTNGSGGTIDGTTGAYTAGSTASTTDVIKVTDTLGNSATATIAVGAGVSINPATTTVAPRGTRSFSASGGSGSGFTFTLTTNGSGGSVNGTTGAYTAGSTGSTTDVVKVTDALGNSASATVTVSAAVTITPATASVAPLGTQAFSASGGSGSGFTYTLTTNGSGASVNGTTGAYTAGATASTTDVVKVTDSLGNSASATITVTAGLTITPATASVAPRGGRTFSASGGSGTGFAYTLTTNGSGGSVNGTTGAYTAGSTGGTTDVVKVTDSLGNSTTATITVTAGVTITPATATLAPRGTQSFSAAGGSGTGFTYTLTTNGSGASLNGTTGAYTAGSTGSTTDVVKVTDSLGNSASATITVTAGVTITPATASLAPRGTQSFSAAGGSGTGFAYTLTTNGSGASINATTGVYTAGATASTTDAVKVTDSLGNSATATITVGAGVTITPAAVSVAPLGGQSFSAAGGSGTGFTYTLTTNGSGGSINGTTGAYTAGPTASATDVVKVTDSLGNSATASVSVGGGLTLSPASASVAPRGSRSFSASGGSGTGFTYTLTTNGSGASLNATTGAYTAGPTASTMDVVKVTDSLGNSATATVMIGPGVSISPTTATVAPRSTQTFGASGGSGTGFTYTLATNASGATIIATTGAYTAGSTASTIDVVKVTDSLGNSATASVSVGGGVALAPATATVAPRGTLMLTASGGSGTGFAFALTTNGSGGSVDAAGRYTAGTTGSTTDVVTVTDSVGNSASSTITVGPAVTLAGSGASAPPRGTLTFTATGGSGSGYVYSLATNASGGTINAATGAYTAGATPSVTDVVQVVDGLGGGATANVAVGAAVTLSPAAPVVAPRGMLSFTASGGSGTGFTFTLTTSASGGAVTTAGAYVAGATPNTVDVVKVTDALGNSASVSISVGGGLAITPATPTVAPRATRTFSATGGSGAGFTFALTTNASGGSIDVASGAYVAGPNGATTDVVRVTDSFGNSATATIKVGPGVQISPATATLAPLGHQSFTVSGGSGVGYSFALASNASGGSITASTGAYVAGGVGGVSDLVRVTDSLGNSAAVAVTVTAALVPVDGMLMVPPRGGATAAVTGGAGSVTFALTASGSGGSVDPVTGAYVAGSTGGATDVITVTDQNGASTTIMVAVGPGISLLPATPSVAPRGTLTITAAGGAGNGYAFALTTNASGGTIDVATGAYQAGATDAVVDVVTVTDPLGNSAELSISVGNGLVLTPTGQTVAPRGHLAFGAFGGSGADYQFALDSNLSGGAIDPVTGAYTAGATPNVTDLVKVTDGLGNSATVSVLVGAGVLVTPASASVSPAGTIAFAAAGGAGSGFVFALGTNASGGMIDLLTGRYVAGPTGAVTDVVTVTDALGNSATATVTVGPGVSLMASATAVPPRGSVTFTATGGAGSYTFGIRSNGSGGSIVSSAGVYTAGATPGTTDVIEVTDALGNSATLTITVGAGVTLTPPGAVVPPGGSATFAAAGGSGSGYVFTLTTNGSGGSVDPVTGAYVAGATDDVVDVVTVTDALGNSAAAQIVVGEGVALFPRAPIVPPRGALAFTAGGGSGAGYVFTLSANASGGTIDAATGQYVAGPLGSVTDRVTVTDALGRTDTVDVTVGPGLSITPATATIAPRGTVAFSVAGGSGTGYAFTLATNGSGGMVSATIGDYQAGATGGSTDVVRVTDSLGNVATATVTVGAPLTGPAAGVSVPPRGSTPIAVTGGVGPYHYTVTTNGSGGMVNPTTGAYMAGPTGGTTDVVTVTDANGTTVTVTVTVGPGVSIGPSDPSVAPGGAITLTATGGSGSGYSWKIVDSAGGGAIDPTTGVYTAPRTPGAGKDVIEVTDPLGNTARVPVSVAALSDPRHLAGGGCACDSAGTDGGPVTLALLFAMLAVVAARRRRRGLTD